MVMGGGEPQGASLQKIGPFQAPGRNGQCLEVAAQLPVLCVSVCLSVVEMLGLGAEQHYSSSKCMITEIGITFSSSKETLCLF